MATLKRAALWGRGARTAPELAWRAQRMQWDTSHSHCVRSLAPARPSPSPRCPWAAAAMFAVIRQVQQLKTATTVLISGPDDLPPGPGEFGAAVATVSAWTRNVGGNSC